MALAFRNGIGGGGEWKGDKSRRCYAAMYVLVRENDSICWMLIILYSQVSHFPSAILLFTFHAASARF